MTGHGTMKIEVRISKRKLRQLDHEVHIANYTLRELRAAGIPVQGALAVTWLQSGELTISVDDFSEDELVYTWVGEKSALVQPALVEDDLA
jgi:hypothetical protein